MKNKVLAVGIVIAIIAIVGVLFVIIQGRESTIKVEGIETSTVEGIMDLSEKIYEGTQESLPNTMANEIDTSDLDYLKSFTGLESATDIEFVVASEPMMNAQAYSLVFVKVTEGADIEAVKAEMFKNIDTRKWICAEASTLYATDYDNTVIFVMSSQEWVNTVKERIDSILGEAKGEELNEERGESSFEEIEHLGDPIVD